MEDQVRKIEGDCSAVAASDNSASICRWCRLPGAGRGPLPRCSILIRMPGHLTISKLQLPVPVICSYGFWLAHRQCLAETLQAAHCGNGTNNDSKWRNRFKPAPLGHIESQMNCSRSWQSSNDSLSALPEMFVSLH